MWCCTVRCLATRSTYGVPAAAKRVKGVTRVHKHLSVVLPPGFTRKRRGTFRLQLDGPDRSTSAAMAR